MTLRSDFKEVKGIVFGRFKPESKISKLDLMEVVKNNKAFQVIPIIGGLDFGHTAPKITFPIGGSCKIEAEGDSPKVMIEKH